MSGERNEQPSAEIRAFIYSCIDSLAQVQILVLLHAGEAAWTARQVAEHASLSDAEARHHLETLAARGLLAITVAAELSYRYAPKSEPLRRYVDELASQYQREPMTVVRLLASNVGPSVKRIADAFRLRNRD